jgi:glycosyltransferase involved in cell wall biosynthesis
VAEPEFGVIRSGVPFRALENVAAPERTTRRTEVAVAGRVAERRHRRLKVLFVTPWYPTAENPTLGVFVREFARAAQLYADVEVLHLAGKDREGKRRFWRLEEETDAERTQGIRTYRVFHRGVPVPGVSPLLARGATHAGGRRIVEAGFRPDVIHGHVFTSGTAALQLGRTLGAPVVLSEHSTVFARKELSRRQTRQARHVFRSADAVLPVSDHLRASIESLGLRREFRVVPNVVDTSLFRVPEGPRPASPAAAVKRILFIGLLDSKHKKGVPFLLEALAKLAPLRRDWHLDIVGDGPARESYVRRAAELEISQNITFHGELPKPAVAEKIHQAAFLVLPSLWETFSVVCAEALCAGVPVLSTRCGGPEEFVTPEFGTLVPAGDSEALYGGLMEMLDRFQRFDPRTLSEYGFRRFAPDVVGRQLDGVYRDCLS